MKQNLQCEDRYREFFLVSSALLLVLTGASKLFSLLATAPELSLPDPVFLLQARLVILLVAGVEWVMAWRLYCRRSRPETVKELSVLTAVFAIYRAGVALIGGTGVCPCVGVLGYIGFIPRKMIVALGDGAFYYLLGGCIVLLLFPRLSANSALTPASDDGTEINSNQHSANGPSQRVRLLLLAPVIGLVGLLIPRLGEFRLHGDEGYNLIKAALTLHGFPLYESVWSDQPPFLTYLLGTLVSVFGPSVVVARVLAMALASIMVLVLVRLVWQERGVMAAFFALVFLVLSPYFFTLSASVLVGPISLGFAMIAVYILLRHSDTKGLTRYCVSGAVYAAALQTKLDVGLLLPALVYYLAAAGDGTRADRPRSRAVTVLVWVGSVAVAFLIIGEFLGWNSAMLVGNHVGSRIYTSFADRSGSKLMLGMLGKEWVVVLPALIGAWHAIWKGDRRSRFPVVWLATEFIVRMWYRPFWEQHYEHLAIPLAWLASIGVNEVLNHARLFLSESVARARLIEAGGFICLSIWVAGAVVSTTEKVSEAARSRRYHSSDTEWAVVESMKRFSAETQWVFTDYPLYAFRANLPVPPELAVLSRKRFASGQITDVELLRLVRVYQPEQLVITSSWAGKILAEYVKHGYTLIGETELSQHWVADKVLRKR